MLRNLICFSVLALFISTGHAAQFAVVRSDKATLYADISMSSPIGFLRKGKTIRVGEVARSHGRLLPMQINKKIVYVKIDDLYLSTELNELLQRRVKKDAQLIDKLIEFNFRKNSIGIEASSLSLSSGFVKSLSNPPTDKALSLLGASAILHSRYQDSRFEYRLGLGQFTGKASSLSAKTMHFRSGIYYRLNYDGKWHFGPDLGMDLGQLELTYQNVSAKGKYLGLAPQMALFHHFSKRFFAKANLGFYYQNFFSYEDAQNLANPKRTSFSTHFALSLLYIL